MMITLSRDSVRKMLKEIEFGKLEENDYNPRKRFDDAAMKDLQNSIGRIGLLEPLVVRPMDGGKFEVICGIRRLKALYGLSWKEKVPCNVIKVDDEQAQILSISENTARHDLTPIEEARAYAGYLNLFEGDRVSLQTYPSNKDPDLKNLSDQIGASPDVIVHRISLLALPEDIQTMVENGELLLRPAETIARFRQLKDQNYAKAKMKELATIHRGFSPDVTALRNTVNRILLETEKEEKEMLVVAEKHLKDTLESLRGFNVELANTLKKRLEERVEEIEDEAELKAVEKETKELEDFLKDFGEDPEKDSDELHKRLNAEIASIGSEEFEDVDKEMAGVEVRIERMEKNIEIVKQEHPERCPFCQAGILLPDLRKRAEHARSELRGLVERRNALSEERGGLQDILKKHTKRITAVEAAQKARDSLRED